MPCDGISAVRGLTDVVEPTNGEGEEVGMEVVSECVLVERTLASAGGCFTGTSDSVVRTCPPAGVVLLPLAGTRGREIVPLFSGSCTAFSASFSFFICAAYSSACSRATSSARKVLAVGWP